MIKVIAFDYAEVIAQGPLTTWLRNNLRPNDERIKTFEEHARDWDIGAITISEVQKILSGLTGILPDKIWEEFYEKSLPNTDTINLIRKLKKNYKIILFSNFIGELLRKLLNHYGIMDLFDEIIISSDYKMIKPDPNFFEVLVDKSGVKKTEIIFTDDRKANVDGSNNFGIKAIQFLNAGQLIKDLRNEGIKISR
jgi:HAD superfamily hydrolase (TIGR01509 family)